MNNHEQPKGMIIEKLKKLGTKDQLLMFVTGPAVARKGTVIEVAFVDIIWGENTFIFYCSIWMCSRIVWWSHSAMCSIIKFKVKKNISDK